MKIITSSVFSFEELMKDSLLYADLTDWIQEEISPDR